MSLAGIAALLAAIALMKKKKMQQSVKRINQFLSVYEGLG